jgi:hypothetical protein
MTFPAEEEWERERSGIRDHYADEFAALGDTHRAIDAGFFQGRVKNS